MSLPPGRSAEVDAWFATLDHPLRELMLEVRDVVLAADPRVSECIKWKSPTFVYEGNMASINPRTKAHVSLMFHHGADIPGEHPFLVGGGGTVKYMRFADRKELRSLQRALTAVVRAWCSLRQSPSRKGKPHAAPRSARGHAPGRHKGRRDR